MEGFLMQIHRNNDSSVITLSDRVPDDHYTYRGTRISVVTVFSTGFQLAGIKNEGTSKERLKSWAAIHPWGDAPELLGERSHLALTVWHEGIRYAPAADADRLSEMYLKEAKLAQAEQAKAHLGATITNLVTALSSRERYLKISGEDRGR